tara:strand:- start:1721 stop:1909 length:189 start_codon:yes stop_codon:yes gene_type:complete
MTTAETPAEKGQLAKKWMHTVAASQSYKSHIGKNTDTIQIPKGMKQEIEHLIIDYLEIHSQD